MEGIGPGPLVATGDPSFMVRWGTAEHRIEHMLFEAHTVLP